jgi:ArsR family transcriptional regulator
VQLEAPLAEEEAVAQARRFKALADPTRLQLLSLLLRHEGRLCVGELVNAFTLEQATISHHLRVLREAGLISGYKHGLYAYYQVRREQVTVLVRWLSVLEEGA